MFIFLVSNVLGGLYYNETIEDNNIQDNSPTSYEHMTGPQWSIGTTNKVGSYGLEHTDATDGWGFMNHTSYLGGTNITDNDFRIYIDFYVTDTTDDCYAQFKKADTLSQDQDLGFVIGHPATNKAGFYDGNSWEDLGIYSINTWHTLSARWNTTDNDFDQACLDDNCISITYAGSFTQMAGVFLYNGKNNGCYIDNIAIVNFEEEPSTPIVNNDHIAFTDITNVTGSDSVYFNFTTNGNYSYTEWYQDNVLKANNSLKIHNFTGLSNVTYYLFNISIYWNSTLFNKTSFNISTLQSTQVNDFGSTNVTQLNDIHTKISYIYEVFNMLPLILLYGIFMFLGYWMITSNNFYLGTLLLVNTLGMDAYFITWMYDTYIDGVSLVGWKGNLIYVFAISLIVWVIVKVGSVILVRSVRYRKV